MRKNQETFNEIFERMRVRMGMHKACEIVSTAMINFSEWELKSPLHAVMRVLYECKRMKGRSRYSDEKLESVAFGAVEARSYAPKSALDRECERIDYINGLSPTEYGFDLIRSGKAKDYVYKDSRASLVCARVADSIGASEVQYAGLRIVDRKAEVQVALHEFFSMCTDRQLTLVQKAIQAYRDVLSIKDTLGSQYRSLALVTKKVGLTPMELCEVYLRCG